MLIPLLASRHSIIILFKRLSRAKTATASFETLFGNLAILLRADGGINASRIRTQVMVSSRRDLFRHTLPSNLSIEREPILEIEISQRIFKDQLTLTTTSSKSKFHLNSSPNQALNKPLVIKSLPIAR